MTSTARRTPRTERGRRLWWAAAFLVSVSVALLLGSTSAADEQESGGAGGSWGDVTHQDGPRIVSGTLDGNSRVEAKYFFSLTESKSISAQLGGMEFDADVVVTDSADQIADQD